MLRSRRSQGSITFDIALLWKQSVTMYDMGFNHSSLRMAIREQLDETRSNFD
ncbi:hypothetical protein Plhal304r1_c018g0065791 [Plasmopara halstedii]